MTFDPYRAWLTSSSVSDLSGGAVWTLQYQNYDAVGNVGAIVDSRPGLSQEFIYDELDRLTMAVGPYGSVPYVYDAHGNRQSVNSTIYAYEPGTLRLQTQNLESFTYFANGNLKTGASKSFTYTPRNMLATSVINGVTTSYAYDADDWRVKKASGANTTYYFRGPNGELLTEWKTPGLSGETKDYVYAAGRLVATLSRPEDDSPNDIFGTIQIDGPSVPVTFTVSGGQRAPLSFVGVAGQHVSALAVPGPSFTDCVWPLAILKPDGQVLASHSGCGINLVEPAVLPTDGVYTLLVDPDDGVGTVTFSLYDAADITGPIIPDGPSITAPLLKPGQNARLTFTGIPGRKVSAVSIETASGCLNWPVAIVRPDGTNLVAASHCGSEIAGPAVIDQPGTYTVLVNPHDEDVGTAVISLYDVEDITGTIAFDTPKSLPLLDAGQRAVLTFNGTAGQQVSLNGVETPSVGGCLFWPLQIVRPNGTALATGSHCGNKFLDRIALPDDGIYQVIVDPYDYDVGTASVTLYDIPDVTTSISIGGGGVPVTVKPGQRAMLPFSGLAGQQVSLIATWSNQYYGLAEPLAILKPDGTTFASTTTGNPAIVGPVTLPTGGQYTAMLEPSYAYSGTATLTLSNVVAPPPATTWASAATASSQYSSGNWSAMRASGAPNVSSCGDNAQAWAPSSSGSGSEWLEATFAVPAPATGVWVRETFNSGFIYRVDLKDTNDVYTTIWTGTDTTSCAGWFWLSFPSTSYFVKAVRIYTQKAGWEEIDAVGVVP
jgi:hypothetical protein